MFWPHPHWEEEIGQIGLPRSFQVTGRDPRDTSRDLHGHAPRRAPAPAPYIDFVREDD